MHHTLLIVAPTSAERSRLSALLCGPGREAVTASSSAEALALLHDLRPDLVVASLELPDAPGFDIVDRLHAAARETPIVVTTRSQSVPLAVQALRRGASDLVGAEEPGQRWMAAIDEALERIRGRVDLARAERDVEDQYGFKRLVSQSPSMLHVFDQVRAVAPTDATVLILGETGTGKELISRNIHDRSRRAGKPFIAVNCGAFAESLLESELFGHESGSFTGAEGRRAGLFEMAHGGTLFLDELGETTPNVQVNLLRVLETMTFRRVGGRDEVRVDVRIIAATHVNLERAAAEGRFREDLFYRLNVFPIDLPPLRRRREDIALLLHHFLHELAEAYEVEPPTVAGDTLALIERYDWPGNVRQLRSLCERWVITRPGQAVELADLPAALHAPTPSERQAGELHIDERLSLKDNTTPIVERVERAYLFRLLQRFQGHLERTADAAGITRRTLYTKMRQYQLDGRDFKGGRADEDDEG